MDKTTQTRIYGLDVLKIVSMVLITFIHLLSYTGIAENEHLIVENKVFLALLRSLTVIAVNCFIMITGYFQSSRKVNVKRVVTLWLNVIFVSIILLLIMAVIAPANITVPVVMKSLFPVTTMHYWFLAAYLVLCLSAPMLNSLIDSLNQRTHLSICGLGFIVISVYYVSNPFVPSEIYVGNPRGLLWFYYLYIISSYIRKYNVHIKKKILIPTCLVAIAMIFTMTFLRISYIKQMQLLQNYSIFPFILSVGIFLLFKTVKVNNKRICKIIAVLSSCSFYVYIIQEHDAVRMWFWQLTRLTEYADKLLLIPIAFAWVLILWFPALCFYWITKITRLLTDRIYVLLNKLVKLLALRKDNLNIGNNNGEGR